LLYRRVRAGVRVEIRICRRTSLKSLHITSIDIESRLRRLEDVDVRTVVIYGFSEEQITFFSSSISTHAKPRPE
jgi:hypothetical protein